ncbi:MlaD family protein [Roseivirga sp.]|uniref:MlaD family protein n=1 Tax=Roseivirga sp. TaxID=1964215 RepID=UPI003B8AC971
MAKGKEFKVGLFIALMAGALYIGFNYLRGLDVFSPLNTYYVSYQNVSGLKKGDRVILNGLDVGSVIERKFINDTYDAILVTLAVDKTINLTDSTYARLAQADLLGSTQIQLYIKPGGNRILIPGDTLRGDVDKSITELLTEEGRSAANKLTSLVDDLEDALSPFVNRKDTIALAIDNFKAFSEELAPLARQGRNSLEQIELKIEYVTDSLVAAMGGLKPLMAEYQQLGEKLNTIDIESRLSQLDSVLSGTQTFLDRLNSNDGTLGKLMSDDSLYNTLNQTMADLDSLFIDLRYNPRRYMHFSLFGRKNRPPADGRAVATKKKKDR